MWRPLAVGRRRIDNLHASTTGQHRPVGAPARGLTVRTGTSVGECIASAIWDAPAGALFIGGNATTIGGTSYGGSIRQVNPATGAFGWQTGLPCPVEGTPSLDCAGVLAVATFNYGTCPTGAYLINTATAPSSPPCP